MEKLINEELQHLIQGTLNGLLTHCRITDTELNYLVRFQGRVLRREILRLDDEAKKFGATIETVGEN